MVKKKDYWKDPEKYREQRRVQYQKNKTQEQIKNKERQKTKYHSDQEWRNQLLNKQNTKYKTNEEFRLKVNEKNRINYHENKERYSIVKSQSYQKEHKEKKEGIMKLCGKGKAACIKCGINDIDVLTIDHKNGRKESERKTKDLNKHHYGFSLWKKILSGKLDYKEYQTLCMNCNWKKHLLSLRKVKHE